MYKSACLKIFAASGHESNECVNEQNVWARGGVKIMAIGYKEDNALLTNQCLGKKRDKC